MQSTKRIRTAYTLIEVLVAMTISLILMLGVATLFQSVGTALNDAQSTLLMSGELNYTQLILQRDLAGVNSGLVNQPYNMVRNETPDVTGGGYFSITEGMNAPPSVIGAVGVHRPNSQVFLTDSPASLTSYDQTVGDVDDILAFTTQADASAPFRGLVDGNLVESNYAEIIWFVRGNTLYRRVLLIDDGNLNIANRSYNPSGFYRDNDLSVRLDASTGRIVPNSLQDIKFRENRFGHYAPTTEVAKRPLFPYPLYQDSFESWYYLRMPTMEETIHNSWNTAGQLDSGFSPTSPGLTPYWDLWQKPNHWSGTNDNDQFNLTGSLNKYVANDPNDNTKKKPTARAAEDVILTNVISFDVKVWNPYWVPLTGGTGWGPPQYIDMGQNWLFDEDGNKFDVKYNHYTSGGPSNPCNNGINEFGFTTKGRYGGVEQFVSNVAYSTGTTISTLTKGSSNVTTDGRRLMPCTYDSWTREYEQNPDRYKTPGGTPNPDRTGAGLNPTNTNIKDSSNWECPPPYDTPLKSIQVTIRCFEPRSQYIRQVRVTQDF